MLIFFLPASKKRSAHYLVTKSNPSTRQRIVCGISRTILLSTGVGSLVIGHIFQRWRQDIRNISVQVYGFTNEMDSVTTAPLPV